jgi:hypothetical protein
LVNVAGNAGDAEVAAYVAAGAAASHRILCDALHYVA